MAKVRQTCGIDIGTHATRVVVMGYDKESKTHTLLATGTAATEGMRLGYITDVDLVAQSIKRAVRAAEHVLGGKIKQAFVSIGGISLGSITSTGQVIISRADQQVTELDIAKALAASEENLEIINKKIIHVIPLSYKLDGKDVHGRPEGMHGIKLEVKTLFVTCLKQNIEDLITALALADIAPEDIVPAPMAASVILLSNKQRAVGGALIDIGAETVSIAVFENNLLISLQVFSIGSMDITKDVALGFKIALEEAESIKLGSVTGGNFPKKKVDEIIEARLSDIFELVENHLKRLRRSELLPAGVVITGGGSHISRIEEIAKNELRLPSRVGPADPSVNARFKIRDSSWYTAYGLALSESDESSSLSISGGTSDSLKQVKGFFKSLLSQLLP
jgi:cell division protein FtsA